MFFLKAWKFKKLNKGRENGKTKLEGFQLIIGICQNEEEREGMPYEKKKEIKL